MYIWRKFSLNIVRENVNITNFLLLLKKKIIIILVITLMFGFFSFTISKFLISPTYQADATLVVNADKNIQNNITYDQITTSQQLVGTYAIILKSNAVLSRVKSDLKLSMSNKELLKNINVAGVDETEVLKISFTSKDPESALKIVDDIIKVSPDIIIRTVKAGSVEVISPATLEEDPVFPNVPLITIISIIIGFLISVVVIYIINILDNKLTSEDDINKYLTIPVLGTIPDVKSNNWMNKDEINALKDNKYLLISKNSPFQYIEAYKALRTNLQFMSIDKKMKKIAVTSTIPNEGKSTVAINLAITLAGAGLKVLLIDADLRKPSINKYMRIKQIHQKGLSSVLAGVEKLENCIFNLCDLNISVLTSGPIPPNPSELLGSEAMEKLIDEVSENYDYVIIDTPPASVVTDAAVLSKYIDWFVLVLRHNVTTIEAAKAVKTNLNSIGANIIGCVFNSFNFKKSNTPTTYYKYKNYKYE